MMAAPAGRREVSGKSVVVRPSVPSSFVQARPVARAPAARTELAQSTPALAGPPHRVERPRLYIDARHGLGNRLRAIASAAAIAQRTGRRLVIVWEPDDHCACRFGDLFHHDGPVIESAFPRFFARAGGTVCNYMEVEPGARKDAPILADEAPDAEGPCPQQPDRGDVYVRSAYPLVSPHTSWAEERAFLWQLRPVAEVADLVRSVRTPNRVAAHVRMASGPGFEHLSWESPANWPAAAHAELVAWRAKSHARHFMARLDALVAEGAADSIFLAADLPDTYAAFRDRYGSRLAFLPRDCFDRSARQAQYALADALLLGAADRLLGSTWSSFTDLARRLSRHAAVVEMSGRDF